MNVHLQAMRQAAVQQRLFQALVRVFVLYVLAHQADRNLVDGILHTVEHFAPLRKLARSSNEL